MFRGSRRGSKYLAPASTDVGARNLEDRVLDQLGMILELPDHQSSRPLRIARKAIVFLYILFEVLGPK